MSRMPSAEAVLLLRHHLVEGRLALEEFTERVELAYRARVSDDLVSVRAGLPEVAVARPVSCQKRTRLTVALLSRLRRSGPIRLGRRTLVAGAFADVDFDLRQAKFDKSESTATILVAFGNVDVYVPATVNVHVSGLTIFGHRRDRGSAVRCRTRPPSTFGCSAGSRPLMCGTCRTTFTAVTRRSSAKLRNASAGCRLDSGSIPWRSRSPGSL